MGVVASPLLGPTFCIHLGEVLATIRPYTLWLGIWFGDSPHLGPTRFRKFASGGIFSGHLELPRLMPPVHGDCGHNILSNRHVVLSHSMDMTSFTVMAKSPWVAQLALYALYLVPGWF